MPLLSEGRTGSAVGDARRRREAARTVAAVRPHTRPEGPSLCDSAFEQVLAAPAVAVPGLRERLVRRLGWGDNAEKRRRFFDKLCKIHAQHEELVEELISIAWTQAQGARKRDRYFCTAILGLLADRGLLAEGEGGTTCERF